MITRRSKYAIRAMLQLARRRDEGALSVENIAQSESLPKKFLEAIMNDLKVAGLVHSTRGKSGGYVLARIPAKITMGQIIRAAQGPVAHAPCVSAMAYKPCEDCLMESRCSLRPLMKDIREAISRVIDIKTLDQVADETAGLLLGAKDDFSI